METQKILVTGGTGFIGTNLVNELISRGHEVIVFDVLNHDIPEIKHIRADIGKYRQVERLFEKHKYDFVYHILI